MISGRSLPYYKKKFVDPLNPMAANINWEQRYVCNNYMAFIMKEYLAFIDPVYTVSGQRGKMSKDKIANLEKFYRNNNWIDIINKAARIRKMSGDVFIYWYYDSNDNIKLKFLDSENVEILEDQNEDIFGYVYNTEIRYQERMTSSNTFTNKTKNVSYFFGKGVVEIYENGLLKETIYNKLDLKEHIQIIHIQYAKSDESMYSIVPFEDLVDQCLMLDYIDTNINFINTMAGSPQIIAIDLDFDIANSAVGPNGIMYFDSKLNLINPMQASKGSIQQIEITNGLESYYKQKGDTLDVLFEKANLIPPSYMQYVLSSDSSKVAQSVKANLEKDILSFYRALSEKTSILFNLILNGTPEGSCKLEIPDVSVVEGKIDQYILKGYKMAVGELTMKDNLIKMGMTEAEALAQLEQYKIEQTMKADAKAGTPEVPIDNNLK